MSELRDRAIASAWSAVRGRGTDYADNVAIAVEGASDIWEPVVRELLAALDAVCHDPTPYPLLEGSHCGLYERVAALLAN